MKKRYSKEFKETLIAFYLYFSKFYSIPNYLSS